MDYGEIGTHCLRLRIGYEWIVADDAELITPKHRP